MNSRKQITDYVELHDLECMFIDGFDSAILGVTEAEHGLTVVYSQHGIIQQLIEDGMEPDEALEFYEFNIAGAYMGPLTPLIIRTPEEL